MIERDQSLDVLNQQQEIILRILEENQSTHFNFDILKNSQRKTSNIPFAARRETHTESADMIFGGVNQSISPR